MELSEECTRGLAILSDLDEKRFKQAVKVAVVALTSKEESTAAAEKLCGDGGPEGTKQALGALMTFFAEAGRVQASVDAVVRVAEDAGVEPDRAKVLGKAAEQKLGDIRSRLRSDVLPSASRLVGIDWRLDHCVRSSAEGLQHKPTFFVTLKVLDSTAGPSAVPEDIHFMANAQQMLDLLERVQDATKQVDRIVSGAGLK